MKLTLLSKVLIGAFSAIITLSIIWFFSSLYKVKENQFILNTKTGEVIKEQGFRVCNSFKNSKYEYKTEILEGQTCIQGKSGKIKAFLFSVIYSYDFDWISKNKRTPEKINIPSVLFDSYMLNSTKEFSDEELLSRVELIKVLSHFYENTISGKGYIINKVVITSPIMEVSAPLNLYKNH